MPAQAAGGGGKLFAASLREARFAQHAILAVEAQTAPVAPRAAGVASKLESEHFDRKLRFNDLDRGDAGVAHVHGGGGDTIPVMSRAHRVCQQVVLDLWIALALRSV